MRLIADEGIDSPIIIELRLRGHEVYSIAENHPGIADVFVLKLANERNEVLLVYDKDFGELTFRMKQIHSGIILIRLSGLKSVEKARILAQAIELYEEELYGAFTVINNSQIKIRKPGLL